MRAAPGQLLPSRVTVPCLLRLAGAVLTSDQVKLRGYVCTCPAEGCAGPLFIAV